jgi:hypothetical protein
MLTKEQNVQECDPDKSGQAATDDDSSNIAGHIKNQGSKI